jgi:hypothetical protein
VTLLEIVDAIAFSMSDKPSFKVADRLQRHKDILRICPNLLVLVESSELGRRNVYGNGSQSEIGSTIEDKVLEVRLAHHTVQEYLRSECVVSNEPLTKRWNHTNACDINTYLTRCEPFPHAHERKIFETLSRKDVSNLST